jgi:hypothetical protein
MSRSFTGATEPNYQEEPNYHPENYDQSEYRGFVRDNVVSYTVTVIDRLKTLNGALKKINDYTRNEDYNHDSMNKQYQAYMRAVMSCDIFINYLENSTHTYIHDSEQEIEDNALFHIEIGKFMEKTLVFYDNLSDWGKLKGREDEAIEIKKLYNKSYDILRPLLFARGILPSHNCSCSRCGHAIRS